MRAEAEVLDGLTGVLGAAEEDDVRASGGAHGELVESEALAAGLLDAGAGGSGEAQSADGHLRHLIEAVVVGDGANDSADLALVRLRRRWVVRDGVDLGQGDRWPVDLGHAQAAEDGLVELRVGTTRQEGVQLVQKSDVGVVAPRGLAVAARDVMAVQVDCMESAWSSCCPIAPNAVSTLFSYLEAKLTTHLVVVVRLLG